MGQAVASLDCQIHDSVYLKELKKNYLTIFSIDYTSQTEHHQEKANEGKTSAGEAMSRLFSVIFLIRTRVYVCVLRYPPEVAVAVVFDGRDGGGGKPRARSWCEREGKETSGQLGQLSQRCLLDHGKSTGKRTECQVVQVA